VTPTPASAAGPDDGPSHGFRHLGENERFRGWRIAVVEARFAAPDGTEFTRDIVRHPGAVAVVPVNDDGDILLVRQYRGAIDRALLEIPAGTRDVEGEPPAETARRELLEEVGVRARHVRLLSTMYNSPGFCDEETLVFLATGLEAGTPARHGVEEQHMDVVTISWADVDRLIASGELSDGQTILGLLLARDVLAASRPGGASAAP
jgi:8-oxo-dGTP pyrophosphatase MutT (NUDIX family)